ncbi:MAG: hypothetical protein MUF75_11085 [Bacteroidia bacterium]|nr:hypothetical protein [Bacteroidia bacterium]
MTKSFFLSLWLLAFGFLAFSSCGPAAEDRAVMLSSSKRVQDSIAYVIRTQMAEAEGQAPAVMQQNAPMTTGAAVITHTNAAGETHTHAPGEGHNH